MSCFGLSTSVDSAYTSFSDLIPYQDGSDFSDEVALNPLSMIEEGSSPSLSEISSIGSIFTSLFEELDSSPEKTTDCIRGEDLELGECVGEGSFAEVRVIKKELGGVPPSPLVLKVSKLGEDCLSSIRTEYKLLEALRFEPRVATLLFLPQKRVTFLDGREGIVFERGVKNLHHELADVYRRRREPFSLQEIRAIGVRLLETLFTIHKKGIVHADVKPDNILIDREGNVRLADFGSASQGVIEDDYLVTRWYRAPEIFLDLPKDCKLDVWSLGCVFFELYTGSVLFQIDDSQEAFNFFAERIPDLPLDFFLKSKQAGRWIAYNSEKKQYQLKGRGVRPGREFVRVVHEVWGKKNRSRTVSDGERKELADFVGLLEGLLKLDPLRRLSAQEALSHGFFLANKGM